MLVVLSSLYDPHVTAGLEHWRTAGVDVQLVTCHDLARPGWRLTLDDKPTLVIGGERVPAGKVRGVLSRLGWVTAAELPFVDAADREYAAAEMHAFLLALLTQLTCPVLNRPTPGHLAGPAWSPERWLACAAAEQIAVHPITRRSYAGGALTEPPPPARRDLHVVGERVLGDAPEPFHSAARALARAAGTDLLRVGFLARSPEPVFVDADPWIDVAKPEIAAAVAERFR